MTLLTYCGLVLVVDLFPEVVSRSHSRDHHSVVDDDRCGGMKCIGDCCYDEEGFAQCCPSTFYQEAWFWIVLVLGLIAVALALFYTCRLIYRYHNAGQYTKLRLQLYHPPSYGTVGGSGYNAASAPSPRTHDSSCDLPSYAAVNDKPPPYSE